MAAKKPGLSAFKAAAQPAPASTTQATQSEPGERTRGKNERVSIAVRLGKEDWYRLHDFANRRGTSLQKLIVESLSKAMTDSGLPPISGE